MNNSAEKFSMPQNNRPPEVVPELGDLDSAGKTSAEIIPINGIEQEDSSEDIQDNGESAEKYNQLILEANQAAIKINLLRNRLAEMPNANDYEQKLSTYETTIRETEQRLRELETGGDHAEQDTIILNLSKETNNKILHKALSFLSQIEAEVNEMYEASIPTLTDIDSDAEPDFRIKEKTEPSEIAGETFAEDMGLPSLDDDSETVTLPENLPVASETNKSPETEPDIPEEIISAYEAKRTEWLETKRDYEMAKRDYEYVLKEHYQDLKEEAAENANKSLLEKAGDLVGKVRTAYENKSISKPEFSPFVQMKEQEFKEARQKYAAGLRDVLSLRANSQEGNQEFDETNQTTKEAFAEKFIRQPHKDKLEVQKENAITPEVNKNLQQAMAFFKKNKWALRGLSVTLTGVLVGSGAGIIAGLTAGGVKGIRMAGGVGGGIAGAHIGNLGGNVLINSAEKKLSVADEAITNKFTVEDINELENNLVTGEKGVARAKTIRKILTVSGAVLGGGAMSYSVGGDNFVGNNIKSGIEDSINQVKSTGKAFVEDLQNRIPNEAKTTFGAADTNAPLNGRDIGSYADNDAPLDGKNIDSYGEVIPDHTVVKGETLWGITRTTFANKLDHLTNTAEKNAILSRVMNDLRNNPGLVKELGISSGNIDLIHPDEKLNLSALDRLIDEKIAHGVRVTGVHEAASTPLQPHNLNVRPDVIDMTPKAIEPDNFIKTTVAPENTVINNDNLFSASKAEYEHSLKAGGNNELQRTNINEIGVKTPEYIEVNPTKAVPTSEFTADANQDLLLEKMANDLKLPPQLTREAVSTFGSVEEFKAAKFAAIERIVGKQPISWFRSERIEPVFEKIKSIPVGGGIIPGGKIVPGIGEMANANFGQKMEYLNRIGIKGSSELHVKASLNALNKWIAQYQTMSKAAGGSIPANTTYNELFTRHILGINKGHVMEATKVVSEQPLSAAPKIGGGKLPTIDLTQEPSNLNRVNLTQTPRVEVANSSPALNVSQISDNGKVSGAKPYYNISESGGQVPDPEDIPELIKYQNSTVAHGETVATIDHPARNAEELNIDRPQREFYPKYNFVPSTADEVRENLESVKQASGLEFLPKQLHENVIGAYSTVENFKAAKLAAIESVVGELPANNEGVEPIFEMLNQTPLKGIVFRNGTHTPGLIEISQYDEASKIAWLTEHDEFGVNKIGSGLATLNKWIEQYKIMAAEAGATGSLKPNMSFNELFIHHLLASKK